MKRFWGLRGDSLVTATIVLIVCPGFLCFGYNQAVLGNLLTLASFVHTFPRLDTINTTGSQQHDNSNIQGTIISLYTIGGMFGSIMCTLFGDVLGRRRTIFVSMIFSIVGAVLMSSSFSLAQLIVARLILGLGTGGYLSTIPIWQSELSKAAHRGSQVVTEGIFIGSGVCIAIWLDFGFYFITGNSVAWRCPLALSIVFSLVVMAFIFTLPESPRWLVKKNRIEEASDILAALSDSEPDSEGVKQDIQEITISLKTTGTGALSALFKNGEQRIFHRMVLAVVGQIGQEMCGVSLITAYATTIFQQDLGFDGTISRILAGSMELMQPVGAFLCYFLIDRFGRRKLMLTSATAMSICMALLAGTTSNPTNTHALVAAVVFLFTYNVFFMMGFMGIPFLYATEVAPLSHRAAICGISTATTWMFNFLITMITPVGFNTLQYRYYIIYAVINAVLVPIVYFFLPESNKRSLEEMDQVFLMSKSIFDTVGIAKTLPRVRRVEASTLNSTVHNSETSDGEKGVAVERLGN